MDKAFIFDWSGTLSDNFGCFCEVCNLIFKEFGRKQISPREIRQNFTLPYMKFWNHYFPALTKKKQDEVYNRFIHQVREAELFNHSKEILRFLKSQDYKLFIVSSDPISKLNLEIKKSGLTKLFDKVYGDIYKKDKTMALLVKEFRLEKSATYYVGDTCGDIKAGKFARIKTIGISWGFQDKKILSGSKPDFLIDDIIEIKRIIKKHKSL